MSPPSSSLAVCSWVCTSRALRTRRVASTLVMFPRCTNHDVGVAAPSAAYSREAAHEPTSASSCASSRSRAASNSNTRSDEPNMRRSYGRGVTVIAACAASRESDREPRVQPYLRARDREVFADAMLTRFERAQLQEDVGPATQKREQLEDASVGPDLAPRRLLEDRAHLTELEAHHSVGRLLVRGHRGILAACVRGVRRDQSGTPRIMPAPTVCDVVSSIRTKLPVARLRRYSSKNNGAVVRRVTRPISLSVSDGAVSSRCSVLMSRRYRRSFTSARADRVVCLIPSLAPGAMAPASSSQQTMASTS